MKSIFLFLILLLQVMELCSQTELISELPLDNLEILDDEVSAYQVFFTGENHYYTSENNNIKLRMLKYLNKKAGVRNLILELGFARGYMLDKYINDDSTYYDQMQYTTSVYYLEMYKALRAFNQSLAPEDRIRVYGVDVERFADDAPVLLAKLLPARKEVPASISFSVEVIKSYGAYCMKRYKSLYLTPESNKRINVESLYDDQSFYDGKVIDTMIADYQRSKAAYMTYLGDGFSTFDQVFSSMIEFRKYMGYANMPHQYVYRERKIYDNISNLMLQHPEEKYYGQFGRCHVSQTELNQECNWWAFSSVARRLNEGSAQDKVLSIGIFYNEKKMNKYYSETYFDDQATTEELKKYIDIECTNSNLLKRIDRKDTGLVKHYQYIIYSNSCNADGKKSMYGNYVTDFHEWAKMVDFGYGMAQFDLNNLNGVLSPQTKKFDDLISFYSFGLSNNNFGLYTQSNFRVFVKQNATSGPVNYKLGGFSITQSVGYMPSVSRRFTFGIYGSVGYNGLKLKVRNDSAATPFTPGFSKVNMLSYTNDGIVVGGGLDLRFAFNKWLGIFARANYVTDLSNKYWKLSVGDQDVRDRNSPKTSVGYYALNAGISFLIQE